MHRLGEHPLIRVLPYVVWGAQGALEGHPGNVNAGPPASLLLDDPAEVERVAPLGLSFSLEKVNQITA